MPIQLIFAPHFGAPLLLLAAMPREFHTLKSGMMTLYYTSSHYQYLPKQSPVNALLIGQSMRRHAYTNYRCFKRIDIDIRDGSRGE